MANKLNQITGAMGGRAARGPAKTAAACAAFIATFPDREALREYMRALARRRHALERKRTR